MVEEIWKTKAREIKEINLFFFTLSCVLVFTENCSKKLKYFLEIFDYLLKAPKATDSQDKSNLFDFFCFFKKIQ